MSFTPNFTSNSDRSAFPTGLSEGLTKREYFAAQAMAALIADERLQFLFKSQGNARPIRWNGFAISPHGERHVEGQDVLAEIAYEAADAMLKAGEK